MEIGRKVSMLGRGRDFRNRLNSCKFPLMGDSSSRDRHVEQVSKRLEEDWGTQPEKPRRQLVQAGSSRWKFV